MRVTAALLLLGVIAGIVLLLTSPALPNEQQRTAAAPQASPSPRPASQPSARPAAGGAAPTSVAQSAPPVATSTAATPSPSPAAARRHTIRAGDTLLAIAAQYDTTVDALRAANPGLTETALRVGEELIIPPR